jgi:branched-subunit amino acid transport protein AzlD
MENNYIITAIVVMAIVNYATRALPFIFFKSHNTPTSILFLERYFPPVIMTILIFYSLKDMDLHTVPYGSYELIAVAVTITLHLVFKNYLLTIFGATLIYMGMVQRWLVAQ